MSDKTKFWVLFTLLILSVALLLIINTSASHVLLSGQ